MRGSRWLFAVAVTVLAGVASLQAGAVLTLPGGLVSVGISDGGEMGGGTNGSGGFGLSLLGVGDAIAPGCFCEGWGAAANGLTGWQGNANGGFFNIGLVGFVGGGSAAVSTTTLGGTDLLITQSYAPAAGAPTALFQDTVTLTNTGAALMTDVRYSRSMDWDVPPTPFNEFVTLQRGGSTALLYSSDNGFGTPDPLTNPSGFGFTENADFTDLGPTDHGAFFTFGFGNLAPGASATFNIFYGATYNERDALAALAAVSAEVYSLGESNTAGGPCCGTPGTYIFAFSGVGGTPIEGVPEPATVMLLGTGLLGAGFLARRRKKAAKA